MTTTISTDKTNVTRLLIMKQTNCLIPVVMYIWQ